MNSIEEEIIKASKDGKINCAQALAIARELKVPTRDVGRQLTALESGYAIASWDASNETGSG